MHLNPDIAAIAADIDREPQPIEDVAPDFAGEAARADGMERCPIPGHEGEWISVLPKARRERLHRKAANPEYPSRRSDLDH